MKYRLKKDLPGVKAGTIGVRCGDDEYEFDDYLCSLSRIKRHPDWFEPVFRKVMVIEVECEEDRPYYLEVVELSFLRQDGSKGFVQHSRGGIHVKTRIEERE